MFKWKYYTKKEILENTPSRKDGIDYLEETRLRRTIIRFMADSSKRLKLPSWVMSSASIYLHRYYMTKSLKKSDRFIVATSCIYLACKVENCPRPVEEVLKICWDVRYQNNANELRKLRDQNQRALMRECILTLERCLLYALGFKFENTSMLGQVMEVLESMKIWCVEKVPSQAAIGFVNDCILGTTLCLQYDNRTIAVSIVYLTLKNFREKSIELPEGKTFYEVYNVSKEVVDDICEQLSDLYYNPPEKPPCGIKLEDREEKVRPSSEVDEHQGRPAEKTGLQDDALTVKEEPSTKAEEDGAVAAASPSRVSRKEMEEGELPDASPSGDKRRAEGLSESDLQNNSTAEEASPQHKHVCPGPLTYSMKAEAVGDVDATTLRTTVDRQGASCKRPAPEPCEDADLQPVPSDDVEESDRDEPALGKRRRMGDACIPASQMPIHV